MHPRRISVFIGYLDEMMKQYKVYAPNLRYIIKSNVINFNENTLRGTVNLNLLGLNP